MLHGQTVADVTVRDAAHFPLSVKDLRVLFQRDEVWVGGLGVHLDRMAPFLVASVDCIAQIAAAAHRLNVYFVRYSTDVFHIYAFTNALTTRGFHGIWEHNASNVKGG